MDTLLQQVTKKRRKTKPIGEKSYDGLYISLVYYT